MKAFLPPTILTSLLLASSPALSAPEAITVRCFRAEPTIEVTLVKLKETGKYLMQVTGTRTEFDGLVLPYDVDLETKTYNTTWHGRTATFLGRNDATGEVTVRLFTPSQRTRGLDLVPLAII